MDANLFSGLLSAIINFSEEITGGDFIKSVAMGSNKFFYRVSTNFIIAISMEERFNELDAKPVLDHILNSFITMGYSEIALTTQDTLALQPFEQQIDIIVQDAINILTIRQDYGDLLNEQYQLAEKTDTPEVRMKKQKIEEAIENAEWALANSLYKDAIIYFHVAEELFRELGENDMAEWCTEMIEKAKQFETQETQIIAKLPPFPVRETVLLDTKKSPEKIEEITVPFQAPPVPIESTQTKEATNYQEPIKTEEPIKPVEPIKQEKKKDVSVQFRRIPYLLRPLTGAKKFPLLDSKVIPLCDGNHTVDDICKKTKLNRLKVSEILRKYHKKKLIGMKRAFQ